VRLAKSSPNMWAPIFLQNKTNLVKALENYIKNLNDLKSKIENDNKNSILIDLNNINRIKKILGGIKNNNEK
jgi:prephenate dehydrogenase